MIVVGFILFAALVFAWMVAPGGDPVRKPVEKPIIASTELIAHA